VAEGREEGQVAEGGPVAEGQEEGRGSEKAQTHHLKAGTLRDKVCPPPLRARPKMKSLLPFSTRLLCACAHTV